VDRADEGNERRRCVSLETYNRTAWRLVIAVVLTGLLILVLVLFIAIGYSIWQDYSSQNTFRKQEKETAAKKIEDPYKEFREPLKKD
jgi:type II secretory pathway component PulL